MRKQKRVGVLAMVTQDGWSRGQDGESAVSLHVMLVDPVLNTLPLGVGVGLQNHNPPSSHPRHQCFVNEKESELKGDQGERNVSLLAQTGGISGCSGTVNWSGLAMTVTAECKH